MALETEVDVGGRCSSCRAEGSAVYRCRECSGGSAVCSKCIVERHRLQPLHRIQIWTGSFFDDYSLHDLDFVMYAGHGGKSCSVPFNVREMVIVHTNGIHRRSVQFCNCKQSRPNFEQLILSQLFPATIKSPATVFTFSLLEAFHQLTLSSKITPYDYFDALKKLTNATFPQDVDVCIC